MSAIPYPYNIGLEDAPGYKGPEFDPTAAQVRAEKVGEALSEIIRCLDQIQHSLRQLECATGKNYGDEISRCWLNGNTPRSILKGIREFFEDVGREQET